MVSNPRGVSDVSVTQSAHKKRAQRPEFTVQIKGYMEQAVKQRTV